MNSGRVIDKEFRRSYCRAGRLLAAVQKQNGQPRIVIVSTVDFTLRLTCTNSVPGTEGSTRENNELVTRLPLKARPSVKLLHRTNHHQTLQHSERSTKVAVKWFITPNETRLTLLSYLVKMSPLHEGLVLSPASTNNATSSNTA
jgi:hypothetical protein